MLGVQMNRRCPDQVASEQARQAYVDNRLAVAPALAGPKKKKSTPGTATKQSRGGMADRTGGR